MIIYCDVHQRRLCIALLGVDRRLNYIVEYSLVLLYLLFDNRGSPQRGVAMLLQLLAATVVAVDG
jgi:hypothetical protein